jgi:crotonobetainyl-CoA:carnitine CoA-transferase CaiB-like acyl-CoA transferase
VLEGFRVLDLTRVGGWLAGRILSDLGAEVVLAEPSGGHPDREQRFAFAALNAGKCSVVASPDEVRTLALAADVVVETGDAPISYDELRDQAPQLVWCSVTPFGRTGPKASWRASDLSTVAQSGNMYVTGDPDRAPVRCTFPTSWYHGGAEAVAGILAALWSRERSGRGQLVDVSLQETVAMASMSLPMQFERAGRRGERRGAFMGTPGMPQREIWRCADGHITFGLRGGPARIPGLKRLVAWMDEEGMATAPLLERDWDSYNHNDLTPDELADIVSAFSRFFEAKTMTELYDGALKRVIMIAPCNTAREILASRQYQSRELFTEIDDPELGRIPLPRRFVVSKNVPGVTRPAPRVGEHKVDWAPKDLVPLRDVGPDAFEGLKVLEFGAGAAGPFAACFLADHGATVVRVESKTRPDFLRILDLSAKNRSLETNPLFALFNRNKLGITLNLKHPRACELALRLADWADVVMENFAPGTMEKFGLTYVDIANRRPDIVMVSTCLHGQTGPEKSYPGFGGQGSALSGFNHLCGWPDREPVGPAGTITDSLSPRYAALAVMAGLLHRQRTGEGCYLDVSQVECAVYSLSEIFAEYGTTGEAPGRQGNRSRRSAPHGAFPCAGDDRWIALAVWNDDDWNRLQDVMSRPDWAANGMFSSTESRLANVDELEKRLEEWTMTQDRDALAQRLQGAGLEAAPVADMADLYADAQLTHREHFRPLERPEMGRHHVQTVGFRLSETPAQFRYAAPTLGRDNEQVYKGILGLSAEEYEALAADGALD